jgi:hypothetical protein
LGDYTVPQYVVTIARMLRLCFKYDRKLLGLLSQCFYASVRELFQDAAQDRRSLPGMIASLQSYGDDPTRFHPHLHSMVPGGGLSSDRGRWIACRNGFFLPVRVLSRLFRGLFLHGLKEAYAAGKLRLQGFLQPLADRAHGIGVT